MKFFDWEVGTSAHFFAAGGIGAAGIIVSDALLIPLKPKLSLCCDGIEEPRGWDVGFAFGDIPKDELFSNYFLGFLF